MLFYRITALTENKDESDTGCTSEINSKVSLLNENLPYNVSFFVCSVNRESVEIAGVIGYRNCVDPKELAAGFVSDLGFGFTDIKVEEITTNTLVWMLKKAESNSFMDSWEETAVRCRIPSEVRRGRARLSERIAEIGQTKDSLLEKCLSLPFGKALSDEIERIFSRTSDRFIAHPVHYMIVSDNPEEVDTAVDTLVSALHSAGRLRSRRIAVLRARPRKGLIRTAEATLDMNAVEDIYEAIPGGTFVLVPGKLDYESETADTELCNADELAEVIHEHRRDCLTVIVSGKNDVRSQEKLKTCMGSMRIVEIREVPVDSGAAKDMMVAKVQKLNIPEYGSLLSLLDSQGDRTYYSADLDRILNDWLDSSLCTEFFSQYSDIKVLGRQDCPVVGDAYDRLQSLIGLERAKKVVNQAIAFNKFRNRYGSAFPSKTEPSRHMVFTGNPGTAKTTVARLFAQIMKDNRVLSRGDLIEVGRSDLVGKYVGWTARQVEEAFNKARGSVLFIDEAYSLCDDRNGLYGDEAINTIVQMMENRRDDTIVIFAGYPDKMQGFLEKNPGLRSRIAFHVDFDDYSDDELISILRLMASDNGVILEQGVESRVRSFLPRTKCLKDFGNGRFIRNLFERARMEQAERIMAIPEEEIDEACVKTLTADDFEIPDEIRPRYVFRPIGFAG